MIDSTQMSQASAATSPSPAAGGRKYKYVSLTHQLIRDMARQNLKTGDRIGTENDLCEQYGLSRITVRKALATLEEDGFIYRKQKKGTFVKRAVDLSRDLFLVRGTIVVAMQNNYLDPAEAVAEFTLFRAVERELAAQGFSVRVIGLGANSEQDRARLLHAVEDEDVEGICAIGSALEPYRAMLGELPLVSSCTFHPTPGAWIGLQMQTVTRDCIQYLVAHGHREIAVMCGPWIESRGLMDFACGFREACEAGGVPFRRERLYHAFEGESIEELAQAILTAKDRPTAVFAEDWKACHAMLAAAVDLGLNVPDDLSILGCGQNVMNIKVPLALDTYLPDTERVGQRIARLLGEIIDGAEPPAEPIHVNGQIVTQGSVRRLTDAPA